MANLISTTAWLIYSAPPVNATPTRRVFTAEGSTWRTYIVPLDNGITATYAYPVDPTVIN